MNRVLTKKLLSAPLLPLVGLALTALLIWQTAYFTSEDLRRAAITFLASEDSDTWHDSVADIDDDNSSEFLHYLYPHAEKLYFAPLHMARSFATNFAAHPLRRLVLFVIALPPPPRQ